MILQSGAHRVVLFVGLLLASAGLTGCPKDDEKADTTKDGGDGHDHDHDVDAGESDCHVSECGTGNPKNDGGSVNSDASTSGDADASSGGGTDAGGGEEVTGGEVTGDAAFNAIFSDAKDSNVKTDALHSMTPTGVSAVNGTLRGTNLSASTPSGSVSIQLSGDIHVGATFKLMPDPIQTTEGFAFIQVLQAPNWFRSASGTVTLDAVQGNKIKFSTTLVPMIVATNNAPGNTGTGTFNLKVDGQVFDISGL